MLRYGLRTIRGNTEGVNTEAWTATATSAAMAGQKVNLILLGRKPLFQTKLKCSASKDDAGTVTMYQAWESLL